MKRFIKLMKLFDGGIAALSLNCKEATRLQSAAIDRELTLFQRFGLRFHLVLCQWCRRYGKQIKFLRAAARRCEQEHPHSPPQALSSQARERIKRSLEAARNNF